LKFGQRGHLNSAIRNMSTPQIIPCDPISRIFAGKYHSVVMDRNEQLFTFGSNKFGQLGSTIMRNQFDLHFLNISNVYHVDVSNSDRTFIFTCSDQCLKNGICTMNFPGGCECFNGHFGIECEYSLILITTFIVIIILLMIIFLIICLHLSIPCKMFDQSKFEKMKQKELILEINQI
jgi:hypothetical protein